MPRRRKRDPAPPPPRVVVVRVRGRAVAEVAFGPGGSIVPGAVVLTADPLGVTGGERYEAAWNAVRDAGLDPKIDVERVYDALWPQAPRRE